jgi:hypothetical protein
MPLKPKDSDNSRRYSMIEVAFNKEQFVEDVFNQKYILVVGSEVIMNKNEEPSGDVIQYILSIINEREGLRCKDLNELAYHFGRGRDPIRELLNSTGSSFAIDDISPELRNFMATRLFPVVLTTTFDSYLETLMRHIWGDRLMVANIDDKNTLDDLRNAIMGCKNGRIYETPTLLYIFGKAVSDESKKYVHTDDDAIQIIAKWMVELPKEDPIMRLIKEKKILALGCKFDDWFFRFFWYILKREISRFREGQVAFMLDDNSQIDGKLKSFLNEYRIYRHENARTFMDEMTCTLNANESVQKKRRLGGIFLSYCSINKLMARELFFKLREQGFNVWLDDGSLNGGDDYNREIEKAIAEAQVFIPLLTPTVAGDLEQNDIESKYYIKEWRMANQIGNKKIIPLAVDGYDLRAQYHIERFESILGVSISGIDLYRQKDGFNKLLVVLNNELSSGDGYYV